MNHDTHIGELVPVSRLNVNCYEIPTDAPEGDGTLEWNSTTLVLVEVEAGGKKGIGYSYTSEAAGSLIHKKLRALVTGANAWDIEGVTNSLVRYIRNSGTCGIAMMAVSAVNNALWDLKAKLVDLPLCLLLGRQRGQMLLYGSGGFTTYSRKQLHDQFEHWKNEGITYFKMKIGAHPQQDIKRVEEARAVIGAASKLMVDANGAYSEREALERIADLEDMDIFWVEEPVSSDNLKALQFIRGKVPNTINIAAGEYGYELPYFKAMTDARAVDVLQADATRCGGISGFIKAGILAEACGIRFSSHCAPALHLHAALALPSFFISEYFHDHVRIESMLFDGTRKPVNGALQPEPDRPGLGLDFKYQDARRYQL